MRDRLEERRSSERQTRGDEGRGKKVVERMRETIKGLNGEEFANLNILMFDEIFRQVVLVSSNDVHHPTRDI